MQIVSNQRLIKNTGGLYSGISHKAEESPKAEEAAGPEDRATPATPTSPPGLASLGPLDSWQADR